MVFISYWRPLEGFLRSHLSLRCLRGLPTQNKLDYNFCHQTYRSGLTQIRLKNAICSGKWHLLSLDVVPVRKSCRY